MRGATNISTCSTVEIEKKCLGNRKCPGNSVNVNARMKIYHMVAITEAKVLE